MRCWTREQNDPVKFQQTHPSDLSLYLIRSSGIRLADRLLQQYLTPRHGPWIKPGGMSCKLCRSAIKAGADYGRNFARAGKCNSAQLQYMSDAYHIVAGSSLLIGLWIIYWPNINFTYRQGVFTTSIVSRMSAWISSSGHCPSEMIWTKSDGKRPSFCKVNACRFDGMVERIFCPPIRFWLHMHTLFQTSRKTADISLYFDELFR